MGTVISYLYKLATSSIDAVRVSMVVFKEIKHI